MEENYLICEDSLEGIFTGIYEAYALRREHERIHIQVGEEENLRLFAAYMEIQPDQGKAAKVAETINRRLGGEAYLVYAGHWPVKTDKRGRQYIKWWCAG